jgi:hypothetical protein
MSVATVNAEDEVGPMPGKRQAASDSEDGMFTLANVSSRALPWSVHIACDRL